MYAQALENAFARDVRCGLMRSPQKTLSCTYFYDELGSALFEAITCLPEYGLTRADARVLCANAGRIAARLPESVVVAELGSGSGVKTRSLLEQLRRRQPVVYHPIDVSGTALARCARDLEAFGDIRPHETNYLAGLREVAESRPPDSNLLVLFLGSTIGNFAPDDALDFIYAVRQRLERGDLLLLGTDMVKPVEMMIRAYDDPTGVTAAF